MANAALITLTAPADQMLPRGTPMRYAPANEQGVVLLFADYARKRRWRIELIRPGFPDCLARRLNGEPIRIEFELESKNFALHKHEAKDCDMIVCWEHNWVDKPEHLEVVELCREYGFGLNIWHQAVRDEQSDNLETWDNINWSVASTARLGDLVIFYHASPKMKIQDAFMVTTPPQRCAKAKWKKGKHLKSEHDYSCEMRRVARFDTPIHLGELRRHRVLGSCPLLRKCLIGRDKWTVYWPELYEMIITRNPKLVKVLAKFSPAELPTL